MGKSECKVCGRGKVQIVGYGCCPADYRLAKAVGWDMDAARALRKRYPIGKHIPPAAIAELRPIVLPAGAGPTLSHTDIVLETIVKENKIQAIKVSFDLSVQVTNVKVTSIS